MKFVLLRPYMKKCCYLIIFLVYSKKEFIQNIVLLLIYRSVFQHTVGWLEILVIKKGIAPRFCTSKAYLCISIYIWSYLHLLYSRCDDLFWPCLSTSYKWISNFFILSALWTSICSVWCKMTYLITEVHGSTYYFIFFCFAEWFLLCRVPEWWVTNQGWEKYGSLGRYDQAVMQYWPIYPFFPSKFYGLYCRSGSLK